MAHQKVLIIVGPTASGKSDLAVHLAKQFKGEVISADSRQVYEGLDIGTGKITKNEMRGVRHYLLDVADPKQQFTVSEYQILARNLLRYIVVKNKLPIVVGGTGFYIDALTGRAAFPNVPPNKLLRNKLDKLSAEKLFGMLKKKDPKRPKTIDRHNKIRLIRALEIIEVLGKVPESGIGNHESRFIFIGLRPNDLEKRIYKRLIKRMPGMIREAKKLHKQGLTYKRMHELGLEYRYLALYLQNKLSKAEMTEKLNIAIRQYAKRQMTWFKRNRNIKWFEPAEYKNIEKYLKKNL